MYTIEQIKNSKPWISIAGDTAPSSDILHVIEKFNITLTQVWAIKFLACSAKYNILDIETRFELYSRQTPHQRKANTLSNKILRYGEIRGTAMYKEKNAKCVHTLESFIKRYGEIEGQVRYYKCNKLKSGSKEAFILRHGEARGLEKFEQFCIKNRGNHSIERKIEKGLTEVEARERVKITKAKMSKNCSLASFIERFGEEEGRERYYKKHNNLKYYASTEGFKEKYGSNYKERIVLCKDTHSKAFFIKKYGEKEGEAMYLEQSQYLKYRASPQYYIDKYGEIEGVNIFESRSKKFFTNGYSKISQQLFDKIKKYASTNIYYATHNKEFLIIESSKCYYFDFVDNTTKRVIEFNGDIYHANPSIYTAEDRPNPFRQDLTSADIWMLDTIKHNAIINRGYEILTIWEKDFITDNNDVIKRCKLFLKYGKR